MNWVGHTWTITQGRFAGQKTIVMVEIEPPERANQEEPQRWFIVANEQKVRFPIRESSLIERFLEPSEHAKMSVKRNDEGEVESIIAHWTVEGQEEEGELIFGADLFMSYTPILETPKYISWSEGGNQSPADPLDILEDEESMPDEFESLLASKWYVVDVEEELIFDDTTYLKKSDPILRDNEESIKGSTLQGDAEYWGFEIVTPS